MPAYYYCLNVLIETSMTITYGLVPRYCQNSKACTSHLVFTLVGFPKTFIGTSHNQFHLYIVLEHENKHRILFCHAPVTTGNRHVSLTSATNMKETHLLMKVFKSYKDEAINSKESKTLKA